MLAYFIKHYCIYFCNIYICLRLLNYRAQKTWIKLILYIFPIILTFLSYSINSFSVELTHVVPLTLLWLIISLYTMSPKISFIATTIALGISNSLFMLSVCIATLCITPFLYKQENLTLLVTISSIIQIILVKCLFLIKRFRNGMPFLFSRISVNMGTILCSLLIFFVIKRPVKSSNFSFRLLTIIIFIIAIPILIHWWQAQITKSYQHSLRLKELESLRIELREKDKQLKEISENNKQMGHIIHEDTKLLRTLLSGIEDYVSTDFEDKNSLKMKGDALLEVINNHSDDRLKSIRSINNQKYKSYSTNIEALNLQLNHFAKRAAAENVTLYVHIACDLESYIPHILCDTDLSHLLSNLLDNAFIATSYTANRIIQLQFYEVNKFFVIEIADSGIPFETESLVNFGLTQRTTHEDEGGSGMGLMEIWKIKEKLGATLHIEEYEIPSPYSKKISFTFNRKNRFSIRSWRKDHIQQISRRIDLQTYDTSTF